MIEGSWSVPLTYGSGFWRPNNIRIRISNTAFLVSQHEQVKNGRRWNVNLAPPPPTTATTTTSCNSSSNNSRSGTGGRRRRNSTTCSHPASSLLSHSSTGNILEGLTWDGTVPYRGCLAFKYLHFGPFLVFFHNIHLFTRWLSDPSLRLVTCSHLQPN